MSSRDRLTLRQHIDMHLDKTPLEYLLYRYQTGEDIEELSKANRQLTAEDEAKMKAGEVFVIEGQKRILDDIHGEWSQSSVCAVLITL
jgi:hypothetical protein